MPQPTESSTPFLTDVALTPDEKEKALALRRTQMMGPGADDGKSAKDEPAAAPPTSPGIGQRPYEPVNKYDAVRKQVRDSMQGDPNRTTSGLRDPEAARREQDALAQQAADKAETEDRQMAAASNAVEAFNARAAQMKKLQGRVPKKQGAK